MKEQQTASEPGDNTPEQIKKEAKQYAAFVTDIVRAMEKHKVKHLLGVFGLNGQIRNSYLRTGEEKENAIYSMISDGVDDWLNQIITPKSHEKTTNGE